MEIASHQDCANALGEMSMSFQALENALLELFAALNNKSDRTAGFIVGSTLSFGKMCQIISALSKHRIQDADLNECLSGILGKCQKLKDERNSYIHSFYPAFYLGDGLDVIGRLKHKLTKSGYTRHWDDHDPEKIRTLAFELDTCTREINELSTELNQSGIIPAILDD
jgi:hypothetical protein